MTHARARAHALPTQRPRAAAIATDGPAASNADAQRHLPDTESEGASILDAFAQGSAQSAASPPSGGADAADGTQDDFSTAFNAHFRAQLHVFGASAREAAQRGPATSGGNATARSGDDVSASFLRARFTPTQREKLAAYMDSRVVPDRLFNGDDVGTSTAQERILLSGHILATGTYQPGTESQRLHARMCGHWANLVMTYAGASNAAGRGVREQFDHTGGLSLASGRRSTPEGMGGLTRMTDEDYAAGELRPVESQFRHRGLNQGQLDALETGDWLWYYNDNGGGGGNHSVIFSRWASPWMAYADPLTRSTVNYRRAICMSQLSPSDGGTEHTALLGDRYTTMPGQDDRTTRICPVTNITRVAADANPVRTADDLRAALGQGRDAAVNERFITGLIRRHRGTTFDYAGLADELRRRNEALLSELIARHRARVTEGQEQAIADLNAEARHENTGDLTTLARLNNRLQSWLNNADWLSTNEQAQTDRIQARRDRQTDADRERIAEIEAELGAMDGQLASHEQQRDAALAPVEADAALSSQLRRHYRQRRDLRGQRRELQGQRRVARDPALRDELEEMLGDLHDRLQPVEAEIHDLESRERPSRADIVAGRRAAAAHRQAINRMEQTRRSRRRELNRLQGDAGRHVVHMGRGAEFQGRGEARPGSDGLFSNLRPQPAWASFVITDEDGGS